MIVVIQNQIGFRRISHKKICEAIRRLIIHLNKAPNLKRAQRELKKRRNINIALMSSKQIRVLNHKFRGKNKPTDILSFAATEPSSLGDLVIAIDRVQKDARANKVVFSDQLLYVLIHGVLHLLGFEHEFDDKSARAMYDLQDSIFEKMRKIWP